MTRTFRLSLYFVLGLFLGGYSVFSHAFKIPVTPGAGISGSAGAGFKTDGYQAFSSGKTMGTMDGVVSGKPFALTSEFLLATTAAEFLIGAVKLNPAAFAVGSFAVWLANSNMGIDGGILKSKAPPIPGVDGWCYNGPSGFPISGPHPHYVCSISDVEAIIDQYYAHLKPVTIQFVPVGNDSTLRIARQSGQLLWDLSRAYQGANPDTGYIDLKPSDEADIKSRPLPDAVATEATQKGVKLPLQSPTVQPKRITTSDPYTDPRTGQRYRDEVQITPQPSTPSEVDGQPIKRPLDDTDTPDTTETGDEKPPEDETDHCKLNPDTIGCSKWGEPEDADLDTDTKNATINPDSGWGAATAVCPADLNHTLKTGHTVGFKWKPLCDGATMFRPVVIGMAWLTATLIFMGIARKGQA